MRKILAFLSILMLILISGCTKYHLKSSEKSNITYWMMEREDDPRGYFCLAIDRDNKYASLYRKEWGVDENGGWTAKDWIAVDASEIRIHNGTITFLGGKGGYLYHKDADFWPGMANMLYGSWFFYRSVIPLYQLK